MNTSTTETNRVALIPRFDPSADFTANAVASSADFAEAEGNKPAFWAKQARELLVWYKDFEQALDWSNPASSSTRPRWPSRLREP